MYTLQGNPDTHDTYASCAGPRTPPYAFRGQSPYVATFHADPTELNRFTAPEKKCFGLHLSARLSGPWDHLNFSPNTTIEAVRLSQTYVDEQTTSVY
jgi:hypothetical protein